MKRVIARLAAFVRGSYPPLVSTVFAVAWACGVTGLVAAVDRRASWRPGTGTLVAALTLVVDLLLMRAIDDIRDLDYDRAHNPGRPLPAAAVGVGDLLVLYAAGAAVVLAVNAGNGAGMVLLAVQLGYALALLAADRLGRTPGGDHPLANLALGFPAQLLVHLYLYACYLRATGLPPDARGLLALLVVLLVTLHLEFARKVTRSPRPGERTYTTVLGVAPTAAIAVVAAALAAAVLVLVSRPTWLLVLAAVPLVPVATAAWRFWHGRARRWPPRSPVLYVILAYASFVTVGWAS